MTLLLAITFFVVGGICLIRPRRIAGSIAGLAARIQGENKPSSKALENPGLLLFIRIIGFFALINAVMMVYVSNVLVYSN